MPDIEKQARLREAIRDAFERSPYSQADFGAAVARREGRSTAYSQQTVSGWFTGERFLDHQLVFAIERVLGLRPGDLSKRDGYAPIDTIPTMTPEEALAADREISQGQADMLGAAIAEARRLTNERRSKRSR